MTARGSTVSTACCSRPISITCLIAATSPLLDNGRVLISMHLNPFVIKAWGVNKTRAALVPTGQRVYLRFHREHVFEQLSGGRRS